jgi:hypothetical protein
LLNPSSMRIPWWRAGQYDVRKVNTSYTKCSLAPCVRIVVASLETQWAAAIGHNQPVIDVPNMH